MQSIMVNDYDELFIYRYSVEPIKQMGKSQPVMCYPAHIKAHQLELFGTCYVVIMWEYFIAFVYGDNDDHLVSSCVSKHNI